MLTVAFGRVTPRSVYEVAESSTSTTAVAGSVTEIVGGFAKRSSWTPRYAPNASTPMVISARTTMNGEKVRPWRGAARGRGTEMVAGTSLGSPRSRRHCSRTSSASRPR